MKMKIIGRKTEVTDALEERVTKKIGKLSKFFPEDTVANVTLKVEKNRQIVEVTIYYNNIIFRAEEENHDMYAAIDKVVDILERQIRKNKTRLKNRMHDSAFMMPQFDGEAFEEEKEFNVVKTKRISVKPMSVEEAILQMNLLGHEFFLFINDEDSNYTLVYKRKDGNYGTIEVEN